MKRQRIRKQAGQSEIGKIAPLKWDDIPQSQWDKVRQMMAKNGGHVIVLSHPFFLLRQGVDQFEWTGPLSKTFPAYLQKIKALLKQRTIPVIILEEVHRIPALLERLESYGAGGHLVVPTYYSDPAIIMEVPPKLARLPPDELRAQLSAGLSHPAWKDLGVNDLGVLAGKLREMGEGLDNFTVLVGGSAAEVNPARAEKHKRIGVLTQERLDFERKMLAQRMPSIRNLGRPTEGLANGCAGYTYRRFSDMRKFVTIAISGGMFPHQAPYHAQRLGKSFRPTEK